jgi:hypothetical protein
MLLPVRTDTRWWHENIEGRAETRFIRGRLRFENADGRKGRATFPSVLVIFRLVVA